MSGVWLWQFVKTCTIGTCSTTAATKDLKDQTDVLFDKQKTGAIIFQMKACYGVEEHFLF